MTTNAPRNADAPERPWIAVLLKPKDGLVTYRLQAITGILQAARPIPDLSVVLNDVAWPRVFRDDTIDPAADWDRRHTTVFRLFCETRRVARLGRIKLEVRAEGRVVLRRILRCSLDGAMPDRPLIYCLHLPKTAGTSLRSALQASGLRLLGVYDGPCGVPSFVFPREYGSFSARAFDDLDVVVGHVGYGLHVHSSRPYRYVSVLRRPETFWKSYYLFRKYVQMDPRFLVCGSIEQAIESNLDGAFDNLFTRWISGCGDDRPIDDGVFRDACEHVVRDFAYVGTTEDTAAAFEAIGSYLGVHLDAVADNLTPPTAESAAIDPAVLLARFEPRLRYDARLYDLVTQRFGRASDLRPAPLPRRPRASRLERWSASLTRS